MTAPLLSAREVSFRYRRDAPLIDEWNADFHVKQMVALTGPSGRGKSTLLYLLGLMVRPHSGRILLREDDVSSTKDRVRADLRAHSFGFVFQDAALDPSRTVLANVLETTLYRRDATAGARTRARALLDRFEVGVRADHKPGEVSGGQAQRIALCRALLHDPEIVLADEPTGNLDAASSRLVIDALGNHAAAGNAVIVATHDADVVARCDRVVRL